MMLRKLTLVALLTLSLFTLGTGVVSADETDTDDATPEGQVVRPNIPEPDYLPTPDMGESGNDTQNYILNKTIPQAINIVIGLLGVTTFFGILIASIQMLTAYGNEDKVNRAKTNLRYGILGFILTILAYGIVAVVVSISLPNEQDADEDTSFFTIPSAYAVDIDDDVDILLPSQQDIIQDQETDANRRVSLPGGDFLGEVVPAVITNVLYVTAFLIFIAFMYGGVLLVIGRGNEEAVSKAKNIVIYAAVALALLALGYAIIYGIANLNLNEDDDATSDEVFNNFDDSNENLDN